MARKARFTKAGITVLVRRETAGAVPVIGDGQDLNMICQIIDSAVQKSDCQLHAFGIVPHQMTMLLTPESDGAVQKLMQSIGRRYAEYFFRRHNRFGRGVNVLWQGRYRCVPVESGEYLLSAMDFAERFAERYSCAELSCSSKHSHQITDASVRLRPHLAYLSLGITPAEIYARYCSLHCGQGDRLREIARALKQQSAVGSSGFVSALECISGIRLRPGVVGRPRAHVCNHGKRYCRQCRL